MAENLFIQLIARLNKSLSKAQIQTDLNDIEKTPFYVRIIGRLNRSLTRRKIETDVQNAARNINVDINARVSERELQRSFDTARQNLENRIQNDPIEVPVNVDTNGIQIHNLNNEARNTRGILSDYLNAREIFRAVTNAIKEAVNEVKALNKAQTDLQIATSKSSNEMKSLMQDYNQLAKEMSSTTIDVTGAADDWLRQGQSVANTNILVKDSLMLSKIGQLESAESTQYLTSAMKGYQLQASDVINVVDKLSATDMEAAVSAGGLAQAMSKCANSASTAGVSMDSLIGYIATVAEVTQKSDSVVGESFKTIMARMGKIKLNDWIDDDGTDISGEINDVEKTLGKFDIALRKSATEFRDFEDVIYDVGMAWDKFSSVDKNAIANAFGGVYQRENVLTLFNNFNRALELTEVSASSAGTAMEKFSIYENSLEAATNRLTASLEGLAYNTIDSKFLSGLANATAGIVEFVDSTKLIQTGLTATLFTGAISGLVALGARMVVVRNNVTQFTQAMNLSRSSTVIAGTQYNSLLASVRGLSEAQLRLVLSSKQLTEAQRLELMQEAGIEQARQRQLLQTWNLTNATNAQTSATFSLRGAWEGLKASIVTSPIGLIVTALTLATTAVVTYNQKQEELKQAALDSANALNDQEKAIEDLRQSYIDIINSEKSASEKTEELNKWKQELIESYGFEKEAIEKVNLEREKSLDLLDKEIEKQNHEARSIWFENNKSEINKARSHINYGTDGSGTMPYFQGQYYDDVSESIKNLWDSFSPPANMIEEYEQIGKLIARLSDKKNTPVGLNDDESKLLDELTKQYKNFGDILENDRELYEKSYIEEAKNIFDNYAVDDNAIERVGKENYLSWKRGLVKSANGDKQLEKELRAIAEKNFTEYEDYYNNLDTAKTMFVEGRFNAKPISDYINSLSDEDLSILIQLDTNIFDKGIDYVTQAIEDFKKNNHLETEIDSSSLEELQQAYENISKSADSFIKNQKSLKSALEEQEKYGQLSASTIRELSQAGYSEALVTDTVTGAVTLNMQAYEKLNEQKQEKIRLDLINERNSLEDKLRDEQTAISDLRQEYEALAKADMEANAGRLSEITLELAKRGANIEDIRELISQINGDITSLNAPTFDNDNTDTNKAEFDKLYDKWNHDVEMNRVTQEDYINWLDGAYKQYFSDLTKYQDEYNKYEEEIYQARLDREQDLFDKKIENYKKLSDNALDDKITDFGVYNEDVKNLEEFNKEMQKTWGLGNVDLTKRPKVAMDDGSTATVLSSTEFVWQGDDENGQYVAIHYTPILPDGTVLDNKSLEDYLYNTLEGSEDILKADNLGIVLKVDSDLGASEQEIKDLLNGNGISDNVQQILDDIEEWDNGLHEVQEQWVELDNKVKSSDSATTYANKWDYARSQINSAIAETQNRINELSLKIGFEDEIEELTSNLEDLYDTLDDINKDEIESQKEYIQTLKDEYSDLMDEQIDQQKKLAEDIEKSYENQIKTIDKQIDALNKVSEAEERQKSILEAEKDVKEAMLELDKAKTNKRLVYSGNGSWNLKEDKSAVKEAQDNLAEKQEALDKAKQDDQIAKLEEQKELLETQKDNSKEYYDKVVEDLENQKTEREKQYDILVDIYEQLGGEKKQTSLNDSLVAKLTSNGDINKAVQNLTPTEMQKAITSGILTTDSNGNYAIDYSILGKNQQAVTENTAEIEKAKSELERLNSSIGSTQSNTASKVDLNSPHLDENKYLVGADGKQIMNDGKPIKAKSNPALEQSEIKTVNLKSGKFAGYDTMNELLGAMVKGEYTIPTSIANSMMNSNLQSRIGKDITQVPDYINNNITNNNAPVFNQTFNVEGSMDEKTVQAVDERITKTLIEYTHYMNTSMQQAMFRQKNKSN